MIGINPCPSVLNIVSYLEISNFVTKLAKDLFSDSSCDGVGCASFFSLVISFDSIQLVNYCFQNNYSIKIIIFSANDFMGKWF